MEHNNMNNSKLRPAQRSIVLALVAVTTVIVTAVMIGSSNQLRGALSSKKFHLAAAENDQKQVHLPGSIMGSRKEKINIVADAGLAAPLDGVYYVQGKPSICFLVRVNPNGVNRGFEIEPSAAMASSFASAAGYVKATNPLRGVLATFRKGQPLLQVKFEYLGTAMVISGVTYLRRPTAAAWKCTPLKFGTTSAISGWWHWHGLPASACQLVLHDPSSNAFVMFYPPVISKNFQSGAGIFDETKNAGLLGGYNTGGGLDGPIPISLNAAKDQILIKGARGWVKTTACVSSTGYKKITQTLSAPTTRAPSAAPVARSKGPVSTPNCKLDTPKCINRHGHAVCSQTRTCCTTQQLNGSPSAYFQSCPASVRKIFGLGWKLVRRVGPSAKAWHPATDQLAGTAVYGTAPHKDTDDVTFSENFVYEPFNQFLFMTGDCKNWVLASRISVVGVKPYSNAPRAACATSVSPYAASHPRWYRRTGVLEDPWVTVVDQGWASRMGMVVYLGKSAGGEPAKNIVPRNGANVYIRSKPTYDANGC